jgi:amino acid adenylation domain-containing protein
MSSAGATASLLHEMVEATVRSSPDRFAVMSHDRSLTYRDLDREADQLSAVLAEHAVGPGQLVAVSIRPSSALIVAILGVLKAGAGYVPVDASHPPERVDFVLRNSGAGVRVVENERQGASPRVVVDASQDIPHLERRSGSRRTGPASSDIAYVIYTSGSTGAPKGVVIEHRHIVASLNSRLVHYPSPPETFALLFSPAFDGSVAVIFWTLATGGCLHIPPSLDDIATLLDTGDPSRPVTDLFCTPSLYQLLLEYAPKDQLSGLRRAIVGGEACLPAVLRRHAATVPTATLHNEYGPTEGSVWSTVYDCVDRTLDIVPIGRPIASATAEVLDEQLRQVPTGEVGELVIGGAGVARGYLGAPELTAARFLSDEHDPAKRRYRTGDLVREQPDGSLVYVGRNDDQIKWNGYRIEPGEIEAAVGSLPGIVEVAVVVNTTPAGGPQLVGFVRVDGAFDAEVVAAQLRKRLPAAMIPAVFVALPEFPRSATGKVDRGKLVTTPLPDDGRSTTTSSDALVDNIRDIVATVLNLPSIPTDTQFMQLGADSLTFMKIVAKARECEIPITLKDVFRRPTAAGLADLVRERGSTASDYVGRASR